MSPPSVPIGNTFAEETLASGKNRLCGECGRSFAKSAHLLRHTRSHAQEKPFSCSVCGKAFTRTDALQRHERTVHSTKRQRTDGSSATESVDETTGEPNGFGNVSQTTSTTLYSHDTALGLRQSTAMTPPIAIEDVAQGRSSFPSMGLSTTLGQPSPGFPLPPFLPAFPAPMSSTEFDLDDLIGDWLNQDGGASAAETALALVFSDQMQTEHMANGFGSHQDAFATEERPYTSRGITSQSRVNALRTHEQQTWSSHREPSSAPGLRNSMLDPRGSAMLSGSTNSVAGSTSTPRTVLTADTWESGISRFPVPEVRNPNLPPLPSRITSPEQVVGELHVDGEDATNSRDDDSVIPSMKFLDSCLHLYFRDFHPCFPIIHRPTFQRDRTSPLLLLSMCSIGCMFVGTQAARERGLWIYERLHYVIVFTRDSKMATEATRIAVTLSALLGQCFSFLYGQPKQMLTAESCHGILCTMARRSGLLKVMKRNPISYDVIRDLDPEALEQRWREWGHREMLRRVSLGLTVHAAEATVYSGLARTVPAQVSDEDGFKDALFEADDAATWRVLLMCLDPNLAADPTTSTTSQLPFPKTPEIFLPTVLLAQNIVTIHLLRELRKTTSEANLIRRNLRGFYDDMIALAEDHDILSPAPNSREVAPQTQSLRVMWHYTCVVRLSPLALIEEAAGRGGSTASESLSEIHAWVSTPAARLATLHCGHILYQAADLKDLAFLLPRAIFQATLLLFCYFSFMTRPPEIARIVDILDVVDWRRLAELCDRTSGNELHIGIGAPFEGESHRTPEERYIAGGTSSIKIKGFIDGKEPQLDIVSLRSTSNRLLRRCTPWGIGDTLGDILSNISF